MRHAQAALRNSHAQLPHSCDHPVNDPRARCCRYKRLTTGDSNMAETTLQTGDTAPDFTLPVDGGGKISLSAYRGRTVVLYFYPKDDTSGCTAQACAFRDQMPDFSKLGAAIIGVSRDSVKKHDAFKKKYELNFLLAADEQGDVCARYGVWVEKSMYGRRYMGIERSTFLIDPAGKIKAIWRKVKVPGHAEEIRKALA